VRKPRVVRESLTPFRYLHLTLCQVPTMLKTELRELIDEVENEPDQAPAAKKSSSNAFDGETAAPTAAGRPETATGAQQR